MPKPFVLLQYLLPRYLLTRLVYRVTRIRRVGVKNWLIRRFVDLYKVNLDDVERPVPDGFATFNEFFTRELAAGARPIDGDPLAVTAPSDGRVSACGDIVDDQVFQAKGRYYGLDDLLAVDTDDARRLAGGRFATIYLAPFDYHRVHSPFDGTLESLHYVPGDLFSVNAATAAGVPRLFARNERLVARIVTAFGPAYLIMVGALNVGSMTTPWSGEIRPRKSGSVEPVPLRGDTPTELARGDLIGWFNMGSTVIVLAPSKALEWDESLAEGRVVRMGESIGRLLEAG